MRRPLSLLLLDLFFPPRCIYCDALVKTSDAYACPRCLERLSWIHADEATRPGTNFALSVSAAWYEGEIRKAFLQYKFYGQRQFASIFAPPTAEAIASHFTGYYDLITWIPVSEETLQTRGYDQAKLLAVAVARELGQSAVPLLKQPVHKTPQSTLSSAQDRQKNIKGCFSLLNPDLVLGKRILLMDDVLTTGATLEEASGLLRSAGAKTVLCATFCRTRSTLDHLDEIVHP